MAVVVVVARRFYVVRRRLRRATTTRPDGSKTKDFRLVTASANSPLQPFRWMLFPWGARYRWGIERQTFDDDGGVAGDDCVWFDVFCDDRLSGHHGSFADAHALADVGEHANPHVVFDHNGGAIG